MGAYEEGARLFIGMGFIPFIIPCCMCTLPGKYCMDADDSILDDRSILKCCCKSGIFCFCYHAKRCFYVSIKAFDEAHPHIGESLHEQRERHHKELMAYLRK